MVGGASERHGVAAAVVIDEAAADDGLGHRLAAGAAHLMPGAVDIDGKIHAGGYRQAAVVAIVFGCGGMLGQRLGQREPRRQCARSGMAAGNTPFYHNCAGRPNRRTPEKKRAPQGALQDRFLKGPYSIPSIRGNHKDRPGQ